MKAILVFLGLFLGCTIGKAQQLNSTANNHDKVTATYSRLIASATFTYDGTKMTPKDSTHLKYISGRGWNEVYNSWGYDTANIYEYGLGGYHHFYRVIRTFDNADNISNSFGEVWDNSNTIWQREITHILSYNVSGYIDTILIVRFNGTGWDSIQTANAYNSIRQLTQSLMRKWDVNMTAWENVERDTYSYTGNNLTSKQTELYVNANWTNDTKSDYTYDVNDNNTVVEIKKWNGQSWVSDIKLNHTYNSMNEQTVSVLQQYDGSKYVNQYETVRTFNSFSQKITEARKTWDVNTNQFVQKVNDYSERFHYETYTTEIQDLGIDDKTMIEVYPVPANNVLHINSAVAVNIMLFDLQGHVMKTIATKKGSVVSIDVSSLPIGYYVISANAKGGQLTKVISIKR